MKRKIRFFTIEFIYLLVALVLASAVAFFIAAIVGAAVAGFSIAVLIAYIIFGILRRIKWQQLVLKTLKENSDLNIYLNTMAIPTALTTLSGKVRWCNLAFRDIGGYGAKTSISKMIEGIDVPDKDMKVLIDEKPYKKEIYSVKHKRREMLLYRLIDVENTVKANELYQNYLSVVCYMQIDNYDELSAEISQSELSYVVAKTEQKISLFAKENSATFLRTGRGKYMCLLERRSLPALRMSKFKILDEVRQIKKTFCPTLSIAIGVGETPAQSSEFANRALELALGRGGDQARRHHRFILYPPAPRPHCRRDHP